MVLRSAEPAQLIEAVRRTHLERRYVDPALSVLANATRDCRDQDLLQPLSRREYQVLQLIADGLDNSSIAKTLFVSIETVRTHVKSILRKLRARDRAHAIAMAFNYGVLLPHAGEQPDESPAADGEAHSSNGRVLRTPQHRAG
ncbi:MAG: response regulator transcription factor [Sciscionella sp.]|nr:response regulator transcription factor [Sciscionella sp.]